MAFIKYGFNQVCISQILSGKREWVTKIYDYYEYNRMIQNIFQVYLILGIIYWDVKYIHFLFHGQVLGLVGSNGIGESTALKI